MKKFKCLDKVEILGTDAIIAWIAATDITNSDLYLISFDNYKDTEAVYPYHGEYRLYPEYMLTPVKED